MIGYVTMLVDKKIFDPLKDLKWFNEMWIQLRAFPIVYWALPRAHSQKTLSPIEKRQSAYGYLHTSSTYPK